jgi:hypothetical protein
MVGVIGYMCLDGCFDGWCYWVQVGMRLNEECLNEVCPLVCFDGWCYWAIYFICSLPQWLVLFASMVGLHILYLVCIDDCCY